MDKSKITKWILPADTITIEDDDDPPTPPLRLQRGSSLQSPITVSSSSPLSSPPTFEVIATAEIVKQCKEKLSFLLTKVISSTQELYQRLSSPLPPDDGKHVQSVINDLLPLAHFLPLAESDENQKDIISIDLNRFEVENRKNMKRTERFFSSPRDRRDFAVDQLLLLLRSISECMEKLQTSVSLTENVLLQELSKVATSASFLFLTIDGCKPSGSSSAMSLDDEEDEEGMSEDDQAEEEEPGEEDVIAKFEKQKAAEKMRRSKSREAMKRMEGKDDVNRPRTREEEEAEDAADDELSIAEALRNPGKLVVAHSKQNQDRLRQMFKDIEEGRVEGESIDGPETEPEDGDSIGSDDDGFADENEQEVDSDEENGEEIGGDGEDEEEEDPELGQCLDILDALCGDETPRFKSLQEQIEWNEREAQRRVDEPFSFVAGAAFRETLCTRMAALYFATDAPENRQRFVGRRAAKKLVRQFAVWTTNVRNDPNMSSLTFPGEEEKEEENPIQSLHLQDFAEPSYEDRGLYLDRLGRDDADDDIVVMSGESSSPSDSVMDIDSDADVSAAKAKKDAEVAACEQAVDEQIAALRAKLEAKLLPPLKRNASQKSADGTTRWDFLRSNPALVKSIEGRVQTLEKRLQKMRTEIIDSLLGTKLSPNCVAKSVSTMEVTLSDQISLQFDVTLASLASAPVYSAEECGGIPSKKKPAVASIPYQQSDGEGIDGPNEEEEDDNDGGDDDDSDFVDDSEFNKEQDRVADAELRQYVAGRSLLCTHHGLIIPDEEEEKRRRKAMSAAAALVNKTVESMKKFARRIRPRLEYVPGEEEREAEALRQKQKQLQPQPEPKKPKRIIIDWSGGESSEGEQEEDSSDEEEDSEEEQVEVDEEEEMEDCAEEEEQEEEGVTAEKNALQLDEEDSDSDMSFKSIQTISSGSESGDEEEIEEEESEADELMLDKGKAKLGNKRKKDEAVSGSEEGKKKKKGQQHPKKKSKKDKDAEELLQGSQPQDGDGSDSDMAEDESEDEQQSDDLSKAQVDDPCVLQLRPKRSMNPALYQKLKKHQLDGIRFLWRHVIEPDAAAATGVILAHSMGLGKSLQIVTLIHTYLTKSKKKGRVLLLAPKVTLDNWMNEFSKWTAGDDLAPIEPVLISETTSKTAAMNAAKKWKSQGGIILMNIERFRAYVGAKSTASGKKERASAGSSSSSAKDKDSIFHENMAEIFHHECDLFVLDEGHVIKNPTSANYAAVSRLQTRRRILLTGTPLQNNTLELYHLIEFVSPGLLGPLKGFSENIADPIAAGQVADATASEQRLMRHALACLRKTLRPCMHRRGANILFADLPPKHELVVKLRMSSSQEHTYKKVHEISCAAEGGRGKELAQQILLQKVTCHPDLLIPSEEAMKALQIEEFEERGAAAAAAAAAEEGASKKQGTLESMFAAPFSASSAAPSSASSAAPSSASSAAGSSSDPSIDASAPAASEAVAVLGSKWRESLPPGYKFDSVENSSKLVFLFAFLDQCAQKGDQVIVFSQYVQVLHFTMSLLAKRKFPGADRTWKENQDHFVLHGQLSSAIRSQRLKEFTKAGSRVRVFFISTKAGGIGINLVSANRVVMLDGNWNPTYTEQALYRAYRYGQTRPVYVYHLVSAGTIDAEVQNTQVRKNHLAKRVVDQQNLSRKNVKTIGLAEKLVYHQPEASRRTLRIPDEHDDTIFRGLVTTFDSMIHEIVKTDSLYEEDEAERISEKEVEDAPTPEALARMLNAEAAKTRSSNQFPSIPNSTSLTFTPAPNASAAAPSPAAQLSSVLASRAHAVANPAPPIQIPHAPPQVFLPVLPRNDVLDICVGEVTAHLLSQYCQQLNISNISTEATAALQKQINLSFSMQPLGDRWKIAQSLWIPAVASYFSANGIVNAELLSQTLWLNFQFAMKQRSDQWQVQTRHQAILRQQAQVPQAHNPPVVRQIQQQQKMSSSDKQLEAALRMRTQPERQPAASNYPGLSVPPRQFHNSQPPSRLPTAPSIAPATTVVQTPAASSQPPPHK